MANDRVVRPEILKTPIGQYSAARYSFLTVAQQLKEVWEWTLALEGVVQKDQVERVRLRKALQERGHTDECYSGESKDCDCPLAVLDKKSE